MLCARAPYLQADSSLPRNALDIADQGPRRKYEGVGFEITEHWTGDQAGLD